MTSTRNSATVASSETREPDVVVARVTATIAATLDIEDRIEELGPSTELLDSLPELDSMAIVDLILALEDEFGVEIDESEITGDVFETIASLADFVRAQVTETTG